MTVTKPQAQMIAALAAATRPHGARRWNEAGVMAALEKVADRNLGDVILATIRAAADRDVETPGVIPTNGSHWAEQLAPQPFVPNVVTAGERCSVCSKPRTACQRDRIADDDHEFETAAEAQRRHQETRPDAIRAGIAALREDMPVTAPPTPARTLDELENSAVHEKVQRLREEVPGLRSTPMRERAVEG